MVDHGGCVCVFSPVFLFKTFAFSPVEIKWCTLPVLLMWDHHFMCLLLIYDTTTLGLSYTLAFYINIWNRFKTILCISLKIFEFAVLIQCYHHQASAENLRICKRVITFFFLLKFKNLYLLQPQATPSGTIFFFFYLIYMIPHLIPT